MNRYLLAFWLFTAFFSSKNTLFAQVEQTEPTDIIEDYIQQNAEDTDFDQNTVFEHLDRFLKRPLPINSATEEQLKELTLLSDVQINSILNYRKKVGPLISKYELQAIPNLDLQTIKNILPFIQIADEQQFRMSFKNMIQQGNSNIYLRWVRQLQLAEGYKSNANGNPPAYLGSPDRIYTRWQHSFENRLSFGIVAEKDAGEQFFKGYNKQGFDYYSGHIQVSNYNSWLKGVVIGDYTINLGQGLICWQSFASGKSAFVNMVKRGGRTIRPYTALNEAQFLRGAGITIGVSKNIEATVFASYRKKDGNLLFDTSNIIQPEEKISALQLSGLHRTESENLDKNTIGESILGGKIKFKKDRLSIAFNSLYTAFDKPISPTTQIYNQFNFRGKSLWSNSLDYSYIFRNLNFFGETAMSDNGKIATINGVQIGLDRRVSMTIVHRYFDKAYQQLYSNPFAEGSTAQNEQGLYSGIEFFLNNNWKISCYYDLFQFPWLKYQVDAPSSGNEYLGRITYTVKRKLEIYAQYRSENKERNNPIADRVSNLVNNNRSQLRVNASYKVTKTFELRNRLEWSWNDNSQTISKGFLVYQDIILKPLTIPFSFTARFAMFETDDYSSRIYSYENDILNSFSVPPLYNKGIRSYLNIRYRGIKNATIEARYAITKYNNINEIGTGTERINGNLKSEFKLQLKIGI